MSSPAKEYTPLKRHEELCSITYLRYALFIFNTTFMVVLSSLIQMTSASQTMFNTAMTGASMLALAVWAILHKITFAVLVSPLYGPSLYGLAAVGGFVLLSSIVGCCGTVREHPMSIFLFSWMLIISLLSEAAVGVIGYKIYIEFDDSSFSTNLAARMSENWMVNEKFTDAIDTLHIQYQCCGSNNYTDWRTSQLVVQKNVTTPDSCCKSVLTNCGYMHHPSNLNYKGCYKHLREEVTLTVLLVPALSLGFTLLQIIGFAFSCALAISISRSQRRAKLHFKY